MKYRFTEVIAALTFIAITSGCGDSPRPHAAPSALPTSLSNQELIDAIAQAEREAQATQAPNPVIELATPSGWSKSEPRPLPPDDHGFTIAYEHESGLIVTFYQYTRGMVSIPNDVNSSPLKEELNRAKNGIQQAIQLGYWQAAEEITTEVVAMGDSQQKAQWSQYKLTVDGMTLVSDIYLWAYANTFFKLRCTSRSDEVSSNQMVLNGLLTSLGSGAKPTAE